MIHQLTSHIILSTAFAGHSAEGGTPLSPFPLPLSVLAVSMPQYTQSLDAVWQA